ncbi:hypothetical protein HMPREF0083_00834 [Aneurinibacillus aneurinilyticus ATCC 12856]|uniref:Uncharacterized protein n=1 Tax=Aneurinibacillus aneurinilyticus ATCC 12856 TaxID=649747 RepID=U1X958_ANEAE|nr:hypothetical protein HMPREF0083_00834 [Aneurinibacillus aneurinilyticus ATCC 12856]
MLNFVYYYTLFYIMLRFRQRFRESRISRQTEQLQGRLRL